MKRFQKFIYFFILVLLLAVSCKKEPLCVDCRQGNKPPSANAGTDQIISLPKDSALLDGTESLDMDGRIISFKWIKVSGQSVMIANPDSAQTLVNSLQSGVYLFELTVTDNGGLSAKDTVQITVKALGNQPPVACAGPDQTVTLPATTINLDGSCSADPDNYITTLKWTKIAGPSSFTIVNSTFFIATINNLVEGVYQFELKVTDVGGLSDRDTVQVTVNPDLSATMQWQKALGGTRVDIAQSVQPTADGGYIIAGNTNSPDGDITGYHPGPYGCYQNCFIQNICGYFPDGLVVKLNSTGAIQWQKAIGGTAADNLLSIQPTPDGGYITSGLTYSNNGDVSGYHGGNEADAWVVKLSSTGAIQWQKVLGGSTGCDFANYILPTPDGGYIFAGHTDSKDGDVAALVGQKDVWIVKLSSNGTLQWQKTLGGTKDDYAFSLQSTPDGGYITAGYTYSNNGDVSGNHGDADAWVVKLSSSGTIQWQKALGGSNEEIARSVQSTPDGGYIVAASTKSNNGDVSGNHGDADAWIVKLSSSGAIQWQKALGGTNEEVARSIHPSPDGGYIVAGSAKSNNGDVIINRGGQDTWVVKLSNNGTLQWQKTLGGTESEFASSVQCVSDGGFIVAGQTISNNGDVNGHRGGTDAWIIKLKQ